MPTFDAADVADQTALFAEALNDTAAVLRVTYAVAAGGGRTETWATASTVAARWARARGAATENATAGGVWARSQTPVKLAAGTDVQERDRLQRGLDGSLWYVRGVDVRPYGVLVDAEAVSA
jgi:hypothetical protein